MIAPITSDMTTKGYIAIHYQMNTLYQSRSDILSIMQLIFLLIYVLAFSMLLLYRKKVDIPLQYIMRGT